MRAFSQSDCFKIAQLGEPSEVGCALGGVLLHGAHGLMVSLAQYPQEGAPPGFGPGGGAREGGFVQQKCRHGVQRRGNRLIKLSRGRARGSPGRAKGFEAGAQSLPVGQIPTGGSGWWFVGWGS